MMIINLWNSLVWLATVDLMWIPAGISVLLIFGVWACRKDVDKDGYPGASGFQGFSTFILWCLVFAYPYGGDSTADTSKFPHFLLWHLVALGAGAAGIASWFVVKGLRELLGSVKNLAKNVFTKLQHKQNYLKNVRGTVINEELELRRKELEKLMGGGAISESIRAQVASLFSGPFKRLLSIRQFLLENEETFDRAVSRTLSDSSVSAEAKKEISHRRVQLDKTLKNVNARLSQIATTVDGLIIRMGEIRAGLEQGSADVEATLSELNEIVSAIEEGVFETQKNDGAGIPVLPERTMAEEVSSAAPPVREGVKV